VAEVTGIAWTDSTFNPWIGCTKVGPGCDHCYAEALDKRHRWGGSTHWGAGVPRQRTSIPYWKQPILWNKKAEASGKPWRVFCASLADVFDNEVPDQWRHDLYSLIEVTPAMTWLLLTKRIGNAAKMLPRRPDWTPSNDGPGSFPNAWLGATIVNQDEADRDVPKLLAIPAAVRWISAEPLLGPVGLRPFMPFQVETGPFRWKRGLDWVVIGGESGSNYRPMDMEHARSLIAQCKAAGVPVFVKQDSGPRPGMQGRFTAEEWALKNYPASTYATNYERTEVDCAMDWKDRNGK